MPDTKRQTLMFRYLRLNSRAKKGESAEDRFPPLQDFLNAVWEAMPTVGHRHVPALKREEDADGRQVWAVEKGRRYVVAMSKTQHKSGAMLVRFCTFVGGEVPAFAPKQLDLREAELKHTEVKDEQQQNQEPAIGFSALFLGRVVLIQNRQGASAADAVKTFIYRAGQSLFERAFKTPEFVSVAPVNLAKVIEDAGGVSAVSFGLFESQSLDGEGSTLEEIVNLERRLGATKARIRLSAGGKAVLDNVESLRLFEDAEEEGLSGVHLHLVNGDTLTGHQLKMSKPVEVALRFGVPDPASVERELLGYLRELMTIKDEKQAVTPEGQIGPLLKLVLGT